MGSGRRSAAGAIGGLSSACALGLVWLCPSAPGAEVVTTPGSGAGQALEPKGLAVDRSEGEAQSGRLYVADKGDDRVDVFDPAHAPLFSFAVEDPVSVAVDDYEGSSSLHDVYAVDSAHRRVEKSAPDGSHLLTIGEGEYEGSLAMLVAVGPGGQVYVVDARATAGGTITTRLRRYEPSGGPPVFQSDFISVSGSSNNLRGLAVESGGDLYVRNGQPGESLCRYDPEGQKVTSWAEGGCLPVKEAEGALALATDKADHLFVAGLDRPAAGGEPYRVIAEYDPEGNALRRFGYGELTGTGFVEGLAVRNGGAGVYATDNPEGGLHHAGDRVLALSLPPAGPLIAPRPCEAPDPRSTRALLRAEVNPQGAPSTYHFQYVEEAAYQQDLAEGGDGFGAATRLPPSPAEDPPVEAQTKGGQQYEWSATDPVTHLASLTATGLAPETGYRCRIVDEDGEGHVATGPEGAFETLGPIEIEASWASAVGAGEATLWAEVNPLGSAATGYFQYVGEAAYEQDVRKGGEGFATATAAPAPAAPLDFGEGEEPVVRSAALSGLPEGAAFRYRLLAHDHCKPDPGVICQFEGPVHAFTTFAAAGAPPPCPNDALRSGLSALLPDCRAYELVSPLDKGSADVIAPPRRHDRLSGGAGAELCLGGEVRLRLHPRLRRPPLQPLRPPIHRPSRRRRGGMADPPDRPAARGGAAARRRPARHPAQSPLAGPLQRLASPGLRTAAGRRRARGLAQPLPAHR